MPSICLLYGFGVALGGFARSLAPISAFHFLLSAFAGMGLWVACRPSLFKVRGSRFNVRRSASGRNLNHRKAAFCPSAVSLAYTTRPGGGWSGQELSIRFAENQALVVWLTSAQATSRNQCSSPT